MDRRTFLGVSTATLCAGSVNGAATPPVERDIYELKTYTLKPAKLPLLDEYLSKAYLPAVKRHGAGPVGVFTAPPEKDVQKVFVVIVFPSVASFGSLPGAFAADKAYLEAAEPYLAARAADPVYARIESSLLTAIGGMPHLKTPDTTKPRLLNLRIYESHNERSAAKKVEMFEKGELSIFERVGLTPVFFASSWVGAVMPNLTYLLAFPDDAGRTAAWGKFREDPEWLKLKAIPEYADKEIVSRITNLILTPTAYSEI